MRSKSQKPSLLNSMFSMKCPRCRKGVLFVNPRLLVYSRMLDMHDECAHCHLKYELEPGFWLGALWTSYPIVVLLELPFLLGALLLEGSAIWYSFLGMVLAFFLAWPLMLRLGRSFWIHVNVRYDRLHDSEV